ncbi:helix-turn-helix domain-containing protein [Xenorhabdus sp. XENO-1]|uniref:transcriptional regulator n=1 Tax=Xenorhabdus bovienii TaxID=40576 RepID=UPI0020CA7B5E|nr:helix-turn-helix domain-containing protein [Xenorhabdus bovienii subsp. africana]
MNNLHIRRAIEIVGSQASLARACGVTQPAVHRWLNGSRIKADYVMAIVEATNGAVQAHELRPDLPKVFPPPEVKAHE